MNNKNVNHKYNNRKPRGNSGTHNPTLHSNERFILIPQNNKYINIYNTYPEPKKAHSERPSSMPATQSGQKVHRFIVRKPAMREDQPDNGDEFMNQLLGSIFNGLSGGGGPPTGELNSLGMPMVSKQTPETAKKKPEEVVITEIDRERLLYVEEVPNTLTDLIELADLVGTKYDEGGYYNIDLKRLKNVEPALRRLNRMVGLEELKGKIVDIILYYLQRLEIKNQDMLHTIIDGAPGTGKTEIAHIYCEILRGLGILSKGTFRKAKKHDLIGGYLGHTAIKTMKLLEEIKGGVLFIDEIYSFGSSAGKDSKDVYAKECVDLLMEFMSENKSDFVLVVAGYRDDIERFFLSMNDGLERRFPIHLSIGEYDDQEMRAIFLKKVAELYWKIEDHAIPGDFFKENKDYFKYYGGDMETLLAKCKYAHSRNLLLDHQKTHRVLSKKDFLDGFELYKRNPEIEKRKETPKYLSFYT